MPAAKNSQTLQSPDVRTWNTLIGPDGRATLIDYGSITRDARDCVWPHNLFLSFMIYAREILSGKTLALEPIRKPSFNPEGFPEPYRSGFLKLFETPHEEWQFSTLRKLILQVMHRSLAPAHVSPGTSLVMQTMEEACDIYLDVGNDWRQRALLSEALTRQTIKGKP